MQLQKIPLPTIRKVIAFCERGRVSKPLILKESMKLKWNL
jgi:hypothetical protein